jgi:hypothetical protein
LKEDTTKTLQFGLKFAGPLLGFMSFQKSEKFSATESGLFLSSGPGIRNRVPLELVRVIFIILLTGNWFRVVCFSPQPPSCPEYGFLMGVTHWSPIDDFGALVSVFQARNQMCFYFSLVHLLIQGWNLTFLCPECV